MTIRLHVSRETQRLSDSSFCSLQILYLRGLQRQQLHSSLYSDSSSLRGKKSSSSRPVKRDRTPPSLISHSEMSEVFSGYILTSSRGPLAFHVKQVRYFSADKSLGEKRGFPIEHLRHTPNVLISGGYNCFTWNTCLLRRSISGAEASVSR